MEVIRRTDKKEGENKGMGERRSVVLKFVNRLILISPFFIP